MTIASRLCPTCKEWKPRSLFSGGYCRPCKAARTKAWRAATTGIIRPKDVMRFWSRVNKNGPVFEDKGPCWIWTGTPHNTGYGQIHFAGRTTHPHLVALLLAGREAPADRPFADHMCRNRACCNPGHLRHVTPRVNSLENNASPMAALAKLTHCRRCGNPYAGANLALYTPPRRKTRHGNPTKPIPQRKCLTCFPSYWRFAVIPRDPPPGARRVRRDLATVEGGDRNG